jgi:hypothetical protein
LSIAIAQTQTEQANRPSITAFTTQCACQNSAISETSVDTNGIADWVTSTGFILEYPLNANVASSRAAVVAGGTPPGGCAGAKA